MAPTYQPGEVLLLSFPFSDAVGAKRRPALTLLDAEDDDILVARITGQLIQTQFDVELQEWQAAGLRIPSVVRLHKLATLEKRLVERSLGTLTAAGFQQVQTTLRNLIETIR
ncbi:type II toxin-antitoxin system PemK/MazF family toxin [Stenomitos frigidus]|uniref:Growth inhibitor n=1 Tax=Stenomitos frigidus ULC18 TaxID=2107698 RepID=A0A2T1DZW9_9CYAN|nr:type II toxin-antitoxin system PemK/MazF family toxin [Stenomitos frigidus]PSB26043.1 growth inhibitor [Stenomitos frigidus ULC18]